MPINSSFFYLNLVNLYDKLSERWDMTVGEIREVMEQKDVRSGLRGGSFSENSASSL